MPFILLGAALVAFLASTRQWSFTVRLSVWGLGVLLLAAALLLAGGADRPLMNDLIGDAARNRRDPGASVLAQLIGNWGSVSAAVPSMLNVTAALTGVLAVAAFVAMSPGETVERIIRPINIGLIGAVAGAFVALALVAGGFAGYQKDRVYVGHLGDGDVIDGDTLRFGDVSVRLWGIDSPEFSASAEGDAATAYNQSCVTPDGASPCGKAARAHLYRLVEGKLVVCKPPPGSFLAVPPRETFGRPIMECFVEGETAVSLNRRMLRDGFAARFENTDGSVISYDDADAAFSAGCTLKPRLWRNSEGKRAQFIAGVWTSEDTISGCTPPKAPATTAR